VTDLILPARLRLDGAALISNWQWLRGQSGIAACGAAVKADGYGTDASGVVARLAKAGCRDFFVATWDEALALGEMPEGTTLSVLHGVRNEDMTVAVASAARPVLNTRDQIARWNSTGRACDVMVDTGMNRLGISVEDIAAGALEGLNIITLMSHLASADQDVEQNNTQRATLSALRGKTSAQRMSLANSAGICLGADYHFDLTRPGLALYGGVPRREAAGHVKQVAYPEAQILQRRLLPAGQSIGYNATFTAPADTEVAILNLGYADGYLRAFSGKGSAQIDGVTCPILGRVSMDLIAIDVTHIRQAAEGDWATLDYDLTTASALTGLSPYELLTNLGHRFQRVWS
jgi:alanine racemase